jgi:hypothetical protein
MLIEIDLEEAKKLQITVNQFLLLKFAIDNVNIKPYQSVIQINDNDIEELIALGILEENSRYDKKDLSKLVITNEFMNRLKSRDFFDEFYEMYPISVTRPDGTKDYLRGNIARSRKIYDTHVGKSRSKHENMLSALNFEVSNRSMSNKMGYMKRMYSWLLSEEWTLYDEFLKDKKVQKQINEVYGTKIE